MNTLSIAFFIFALALLAVPLLPRLSAFRRCLFPALVLIALGVCYSQKAYLNPMMRLFFSAGFQQGWEAPTIDPNLDSDGDGLSDEIEKSGYFPRVIPLDATIFDRPEDAVDLWTDWAGTHEVTEWPFGDGFSFPVHTNAYTKAGVSQSGMLCFGGALNSTVPILYPLEKSDKNRLRRGIPQFAFFQGLNRIAPGAGSQVFHTTTDAGTRRLVFKNIFLDDLNTTTDVAVELFKNGNLRFSYAGNLPLSRRAGWHVGEGGLMVTDLTGGYALELLAFLPTDPNNRDTDGDGWSDYDEVVVYGTNPHAWESDINGDGIPDWLENYLGHVPTREEWEALLVDGDGNSCPDLWECVLSNHDGVGLVRIEVEIEGDSPVSVAIGDLAIPFFPGENSTVVPVPWGVVFELPSNFTIQSLPGGALMKRIEAGPLFRVASVEERFSKYQLIRIILEPASGEEPFGQGGKVCIHPHDGPRSVSLKAGNSQDGVSLNFEGVYWNWSGAGEAGRSFSGVGSSASLSIEIDDSAPLGTLSVTGMPTIEPEGVPWIFASPFVSKTYAVRRCPPALAGEGITHGTGHTTCPLHVIPGHCCVHSRFCSNQNGCCPPDSCTGGCPPEDPSVCYKHLLYPNHCCLHSGCRPLDQAPDDDSWLAEHCSFDPQCSHSSPQCPDAEDPEEPVSATLTLAVLRIDNNDSDANGIRDLAQPFHAKPDPDWQKLAVTIDPLRFGPCCECPDHGTGGQASVWSDSLRAVTATGQPLTLITPQDLPLYAQGLAPSQNFFDQTLIFQSGQHIATNLYTVGALALEPADRMTLAHHPATNDWVIQCGDFYPLVIRSEVFVPGEFSLKLEHTSPLPSPQAQPAAFELWIPPVTRDHSAAPSFCYETYAADYLAGNPASYTRNLPGALNVPFMTSLDAPKTIILNNITDEPDFLQNHFITPTNRVVWVRANIPGTTTLTYTYHKIVMGVEIKFEDTLTITAPNLSLDLDADNDGAISPRHTETGILENRYKLYAPGKILPIDGHGVATNINELAEIHLNHPSTPGILTFDAPTTNFVFYADTNRVNRLTPPCVWNLATETPPNRLYADAVTNGTTRLTLTYTLPSGVALTNTAHLTAIPTISHAPGRGANAAIWAPLKIRANLMTSNNIGWGDGETLERCLAGQGWPVVEWIEDTTGDSDTNFGDCTLAHYRTMVTNGLISCISHGSTNDHYAVYAENTPAGEAAILAWIGNEAGIRLEFVGRNRNTGLPTGCHSAVISSEWHAANWKAGLNQNQAITVWSICYSANTFPNRESIADAAGGRWRIGYMEPTSEGEASFVNTNLFSRMNGSWGNGNLRTAQEAFDDMRPHLPTYTANSLRMRGNGWTTLCPANAKTPSCFPISVSTTPTGFGCVLFDTYIDTAISPSQIVIAENGVSLTDIHWISDHGGAFGIGFRYHRNGQSEAVVRVEASSCKNKGFADGRDLDPDRITPNGGTFTWRF